MPVVQNPDGTYTRQKSGRDVSLRGTKKTIGANLALGHGLVGKQDVKEGGKHAFTLYGRGNDPGFYGKNFAGAREGWNYDWNTGMKMMHSAPDNPNFKKWVPIEDWEQKRHTNMQNYLGANEGKNAADYVTWRNRRKGGYKDQVGGYLVNQAGELRDAKTGYVVNGRLEDYGLSRPGAGDPSQMTPTSINGQQVNWEQLFDQLFGNGQYRAQGTPSNQWRPSWLPQDASAFL